MALSQAEKDKIFKRIMQRWSDSREPCGFVKSAVQTAISDADSWLDTNQAAFNLALNAPFRSGATLQQKGLVLCYVAMVMAGLRPEDF